jgi:hypothetical protein
MSEITHFVFVDFENVPSVDLTLVSGKPVHVTLLIGNKQTKLDTLLSVQLNQFAGQVRPVMVGASGRNALDLTLAYYLGEATRLNPGVSYHIVSKDKDFDPLIAHLRTMEVRIARCDSVAALPFVTVRKRGTTKSPFPVEKPAPAPKTAVAPKAKPSVDKYPKLLEQVTSGKNRPGTRARLMHHIHTLYGQKSSPEQLTAVVNRLIGAKVITIAESDKVTYL